tara:strand:+ start:21 stop:461 length:441 start_codon:yes stop_codon:yes gene_type:complete
MSELEFRSPNSSHEFEEYDLFRWKILREPLGKSIESLKDSFEDKSFHLIAIKESKIIACGRLHFNSKLEAQVRYMAVEEHLQGQGIGKKILEILEYKAKENNVTHVVLNARDHVIKFYENSGYRILEKYNGSDTGIPHTTMRKKLN